MQARTLILLCFFTLTSCSKHQFSEFDYFDEDNRWQQTDAKTFEFEIPDDSKSYNVIFRFSHIYDYQFASIPINFNIENPNGTNENFTINLAIKDAQGRQLADCSGDDCDLNYTLKQNAKLTKGKYKVTISHKFPVPYLPNLIGIGLYVDAVK